MAISGKILIDKLRICIPIDALVYIEHTDKSYIANAREVLSNYFPARAYSVSNSRNEIKITLTPTRFKPPHNMSFTDVNIEMPAESWLLNLLKVLGFTNRRFSESSRIVMIHLTKNIITKNRVGYYIKFVSQYPLKLGYKSAFVYSSDINRTLRIATQKHNTEKDDINGQRNIIFYDKIQELLDKANLDNIYLKEPLSKEVIKELKSYNVFYNREFNRLSLNNLNLLRCELQYKYKEKIKPLANFLNGNTDDTLTVATLMDLLAENQLYEKLDTFYVKQLKEVIFYKEPDKQENKTFTSFQHAFSELLKKSDIGEMQLIYNACGLSNKFHKNLIKIFCNTNNDLYNELYNKLGIAKNIDLIEV